MEENLVLHPLIVKDDFINGVYKLPTLFKCINTTKKDINGNDICSDNVVRKGAIVSYEAYTYYDPTKNDRALLIFGNYYSTNYNQKDFIPLTSIEYNEVIDRLKAKQVPKVKNNAEVLEYWINYKLVKDDIIGELKGYPLDLAQMYFSKTMDYYKPRFYTSCCDIYPYEVLDRIQNSCSFGFSWFDSKDGLSWSSIRLQNDFSSYYDWLGKVDFVVDTPKSTPIKSEPITTNHEQKVPEIKDIKEEVVVQESKVSLPIEVKRRGVRTPKRGLKVEEEKQIKSKTKY